MLKTIALLISVLAFKAVASEPVPSVKPTSPQILIPQMAKDKTQDYVGADWFAVPHISFKNTVLKGSVKFKPAIPEEYGETAQFVLSDGKDLEDDFFNFTFVRGIGGMAPGNVVLPGGLDCLQKADLKWPKVCSLTLGKSKVVITKEISTQKTKEDLPLYRISIRPEGGKEIVVIASQIAFAGDLNNDGKIDLIVETSDFTLKTELYLSDPKSNDLNPVARAESGGC